MSLRRAPRAGRASIAALVCAAMTTTLVAVPGAATAAPSPRTTSAVGPASVDPLDGLVTNGPIYDIARSGGTTYVGGDFDYLGVRTGPLVGVSATTGEQVLDVPLLKPYRFSNILGGGGSALSGPHISTIRADGAGGWYVAGAFAVADDEIVGVARVSPTGTVQWATEIDSGFYQGYPINAWVRSLEVHDDVLLISGFFANVGNQPHNGVAAIDPDDGSVLPFTSAVTGDTRDATLANGVVYIAQESRLRAVNYPSGTARSLNVSVSTLHDVEYYDGRVMTNAGTFDDGGNVEPTICPIGRASVRSGTELSTVTSGGVVTCDLATAQTLSTIPVTSVHAKVDRSGDTLYVSDKGSLAAYDAGTGDPLAWNRTTNDTDGGDVFSYAIAQSAGTVLAWQRQATSLDVAERANLAAIDADGDITAWDPSANDTVRALVVDGDDLVVGGAFTQVDQTLMSRLARVDLTSGAVRDWTPVANGTVQSLDVAAGVTYAGGQFTTVNGDPHNRLAAIDSAGNAIPTWTAGASSTVSAIDEHDGVLYVGGVFTQVTGSPRNRLAALDAIDGSLLPWNPGADDLVRTVAATTDAVYVGGAFQEVDGQPRARAAAIDPVSGDLLGWDPGTDGEVWSIAVDDVAIYLGGTFTTVASAARQSLAAVSPGGQLLDWAPDPSGAVYALVAADGLVSAAGAIGSGAFGFRSTRSTPTFSATLLPSEATTISFAQYPAPTETGITGAVTDVVSGEPVNGAFVAALTSSGFAIAGGAQADENGNFSLPVPAGSYYLYLFDPRGAHQFGFFGAPEAFAVTGGNQTDATLTMTTTRGAIGGTVTEAVAGTPLADVAAIVLSSTGISEAATLTDGAGAYHVPGLRAGNHFIGFVDTNGAHPVRFFPNSGDVPNATQLAVAAGATTPADGVLPTQAPAAGASTLSGTVTESPSGAPLTGVLVIALDAANFRLVRATTTDPGGHYEMSVPAGTYKLAFLDTNGTTSFEWFDDQPNTGLASATSVSAPGVVDESLLRNTGSISGTVSDAVTAEPLDGAWAVAIASDGSIAGGTTTDLDGDYTIAELPPGSYRVTFVDPNGGRRQEYYDGSFNSQGAQVITVTAAAVTGGIDAGLAAP